MRKKIKFEGKYLPPCITLDNIEMVVEAVETFKETKYDIHPENLENIHSGYCILSYAIKPRFDVCPGIVGCDNCLAYIPNANHLKKYSKSKQLFADLL